MAGFQQKKSAPLPQIQLDPICTRANSHSHCLHFGSSSSTPQSLKSSMPTLVENKAVFSAENLTANERANSRFLEDYGHLLGRCRGYLWYLRREQAILSKKITVLLVLAAVFNLFTLHWHSIVLLTEFFIPYKVWSRVPGRDSNSVLFFFTFLLFFIPR